MSHPKSGVLKGLMTAILTPFDRNGGLALEHMPALLGFQQQAGIEGVAVCGTNGEGTSLSVDEHKRTLEAAIASRGSLSVIAGTGATSVTDAVELTRHAEKAGADGALVLPPFFIKSPTAQGVADYFRAVLDAADLPILLYNIPQFTAVPITDEIIEMLLDHPNLAGLKDSAGDWSRTLDLITRYPHLRIFSGSDFLIMQGYAHGAVGAISGGGNAFPEALAAIRDASDIATAGPLAQAAQTRMDAITDILLRYPMCGVAKSVIAHRGLPRLGVRPSLVSLTPEQEDRLITELGAGGYL